MKPLAAALLILSVHAGAFAATETWTHVSLVDTQCAPKVKENPDAHKTQCALQCAKGGFGIFTENGTFLKLDEPGNQKAVAALKAAKSPDHLRVTVSGVREGEAIKVAELTLDEAAH